MQESEWKYGGKGKSAPGRETVSYEKGRLGRRHLLGTTKKNQLKKEKSHLVTIDRGRTV